MSWVATAIAGSAIIGGASSYLAGKESRKGAEAAGEIQRYMYDQSREDMAPYREVGVSALSQLAELYGLDSPSASGSNEFGRSTNPTTTYQYSQSGKVNEYEVVQAFMEFLGRRPSERELDYYTGRERGNELYYDVVVPGMENMQAKGEFQGGSKTNPPTASPGDRFARFRESPDYQFALEQGQRATDQSLAARGLTNSGRAMKELTRFGQGLASQQLNNYANRLASLAGVGQTSTTATANLGANAAARIGGATQDAADARASGYLGVGNAVGQGVGQAVNWWQTNRMLDALG